MVIALVLLFVITSGIAEGFADRISSLGECSISIVPMKYCKVNTAKNKKRTKAGLTLLVMFSDPWHALDKYSDVANYLAGCFAAILLLPFAWYYWLLLPLLYGLKKFVFQLTYAWYSVKPEYRKTIFG